MQSLLIFTEPENCTHSPSSVDLTLSGFLKTRLLSLDSPWIVGEQLEELERSPGAHIVGLDGPRNGWHTSLALACGASTMHTDVNIKHASVGSH